MIPRRRRLSDIAAEDVSHTERLKRQKNNAHFDQMIQSMSRGGRQRKESSGAYTLSTALASELSFRKKTDPPSLLNRSSSASNVSSQSSSSHRTCNPLPQWLVNTFKTLSKKNPLRRLVPPDSDISEGSGVLHTQTEPTARPIDVSAAGPVFAFNVPEPNRIQAQRSEYLIAQPQTTLLTDDDQESWPEPLPFSTPGPGSLLGSSVASNIAFSLPNPKKKMSSVSYASKTPSHIRSDLPSNRSHTPVHSSNSLPSDPSTSYDPFFKIFATDDVRSSWNPSMPEEDCQSLFSNIYSAPGPRYCTPRPVHFDFPFEDPMSSDPMSSDPSQSGCKIGYDAIDFRWKPFNRKNLVVPDRFQKPIYASGPAHYGASDISEYEPTYAVKPVDVKTNTLNSQTPEPASPLLSISPAPYHSLLPPENDTSTPIPKSQVQIDWKPFDRKHIVVPDRFQKIIYASGPAQSNGTSDTFEYEPTYTVKPVVAKTNSLNSHVPGPAPPLLPISPAPFRFLLPSESNASTPVPKSQVQIQWKPFDRKNLVVPDRFQRPIYASGPAHSNGTSDTSEYKPTYAVKPVDAETDTLNPHTPEPASPLLCISPAPFRFLLPPENNASTPVSKSQVQNAVQKPSTPKKSPYFAVPGIYISPLHKPRKVYDTVTTKEHDSDLSPARDPDDDATNGVEQAKSQVSNDSIESWEENLS